MTVSANTCTVSKRESERQEKINAAADFYVEDSDDGCTWYEDDSFSEIGAVTDKVAGYLSA